MSEARISYFSLQGFQGKEAKLDWIAGTRFEEIEFENVNPDGKGNWINQTHNDFDGFLSLVDKKVKAGRSEKAVFKIFSRGLETGRDEWIYDISKDELIKKVQFFSKIYNSCVSSGKLNFEIKWNSSLEEFMKSKIKSFFNKDFIQKSLYRPYSKLFHYTEKIFNHRLTRNHYEMFSFDLSQKNLTIVVTNHTQVPFSIQITDCIPTLDAGSRPSENLPLYRYDENGDRVENITDWALERFREHYLPSPPAPLPQERGARLEQKIEAGLNPDLARLAGARRDIPEVLLQKAKELRQKQTPAEQMLWQCLRANQLHGAKFRRQHNIGQYIVDFYCHAAKLVIELDGGIHELQKDRDSDRDKWLQANDLQVFRFQNEEITQNLPQVLQTITNHLFLLSPSPAGEGLGVRAETFAKEGLRAETITKLDIFHYIYSVLHHPAYRTKYELNLKREFPRLPFYADFHQWAAWGKDLMELHLNYETIEPYGLRRVDVGRKKSASDTPLQATLIPIDAPDPAKPIKRTIPKAKLKADKTEGKIILDTETILEGVPAVAWDYKLGNRSALEWILDQYKEKTPKDPTIAKLFNTYKFADYKEHVIDLLQRVCTVSVRTMEIIQQMPDTVEYQGG